MTMRLLFLIPVLLLPGCVRTIATVVTAPVKVASQAADWATTSQDEADRNAGRAARKAEEREAKERRQAEKEARRNAERDDD